MQFYVKPPIKLRGKVVFVQNTAELWQLATTLPASAYHESIDAWEIPFSEIEYIVFKLNLDESEYSIIHDFLPEPHKVHNLLFKTKPYEHQVACTKYGLKHDRFLLADDMGLGKSKQILDIAMNRDVDKLLVICGVNSIKWNWQKEVAVHSHYTSIVIGGNASTTVQKVRDLQTLTDEVAIVNIESLRNKHVLEALQAISWDMIAVDEIHKAKNPSSQQGKALLQLSAPIMIAATGTPIMNNPLDAYVTLKWLGFENRTFFDFKEYYTISQRRTVKMFNSTLNRMVDRAYKQTTGYKNMQELRDAFAKYSLRRRKEDVLDLPRKIRTTEIVEMGKKQASIYSEVLTAIKQEIDKIKMAKHPLSKLIRLRQATGYTGILSSEVKLSAKLDRMEELVEDVVAAGDKCIVFSNFSEITNEAFNRLKKYNPAIITGEVKDRKEQEAKFKKNKDCHVIIGTIGAMGTGLTLTEASTVIFLDSPWNSANKTQAEDRAHRIGTKKPVSIITLVTKGTIDERIEELVDKKARTARILVDGEFEKGEKEKMIDFLVS